jgi:hypothetical protein
MATEEWRATTYDAYAAALDREQRAADHYALELHARRERLWCAAEPERRSREM